MYSFVISDTTILSKCHMERSKLFFFCYNLLLFVTTKDECGDECWCCFSLYRSKHEICNVYICIKLKSPLWMFISMFKYWSKFMRYVFYEMYMKYMYILKIINEIGVIRCWSHIIKMKYFNLVKNNLLSYYFQTLVEDISRVSREVLRLQDFEIHFEVGNCVVISSVFQPDTQ